MLVSANSSTPSDSSLSRVPALDIREPLENVFLELMKKLSDQTQSPLEIARDIVKRTAELVEAEICTWFRVTSDRQKLVLVAAHGAKQGLVPAHHDYPLPWDCGADDDIEGLTAWLAVRGEEFSANSFRQLSAHRSHRGRWDAFVWGQRPDAQLKMFGVPLRLSEIEPPRDSVIGVLKVERCTPEAFTDKDKYVVRLMAKYIALCLEYRQNVASGFLQNVGHPFFGALQTFINILRDAAFQCEGLRNAEFPSAVQKLAEGIARSIDMGLVHALFVNQSMTSVKNLLVSIDSDVISPLHSRKSITPLLQTVVTSIQELANAQASLFPASGSFEVEFATESDDICITLTPAAEEALTTITRELLHNALKHAGVGGRAVLHVIEKTECVIIEVRDFGNGIPKDNLQQIFEEGFHTGVRFGPEGLGFGLAMVRSLTTMFGWPPPEVMQHTKPEECGTSFILQLPKGSDHESTHSRG